MHTVKELIAQGAKELSAVSSTARLDAELLMAYVLELSRTGLITESNQPVIPEKAEVYAELLDRRKEREPVAYIIGQKEFWGLSFQVTSKVLIPRPETEHIIEYVLEQSRDLSGSICIADLGTGSGCIAISLAHAIKEQGRQIRIVASDKEEAALETARRNADLNSVSEYIEFRKGSWFECFERGRDWFHFVISNPPYVNSSSIDSDPALAFEPRSALDGGSDGLNEYPVLLKESASYLYSGGQLVLEFGFGQRDDLHSLVTESLSDAAVEFHNDLAGIPRFCSVSFP